MNIIFGGNAVNKHNESKIKIIGGEIKGTEESKIKIIGGAMNIHDIEQNIKDLFTLALGAMPPEKFAEIYAKLQEIFKPAKKLYEKLLMSLNILWWVVIIILILIIIPILIIIIGVLFGLNIALETINKIKKPVIQFMPFLKKIFPPKNLLSIVKKTLK